MRVLICPAGHVSPQGQSGRPEAGQPYRRRSRERADAGLFPAVAMKLLDFVGIYGMVLAPVGAIIVVDVSFSKRLGFLSDPAAATGSTFNVAALLAWIVPALIGFWAVGYFDMPLPTYATLPVWLGSGLLYIVLAKPLGPKIARVVSL